MMSGVGTRGVGTSGSEAIGAETGSADVPRVLVAAGADGLRTADWPTEPPAAGRVRIMTECSLVSPGTELHYLDQCRKTGAVQPLGYCAAGTVRDVGEGVPGLAPGDRVIAMGWNHAVHADVVSVPWRLVQRVPDELPLTSAVVADIAATAVHAGDRAGLHDGDEVLVVGAGLVGQLVAQVARDRGAAVSVMERNPGRMAAAQRLGAAPREERSLTGPEPGEPLARRCVFVCATSDATQTLRAALAWAARGPGRPVVVAVGRFSAGIEFSAELGNIDLRNSARCGTGYRDDDYVHGRRDLTPPEGEDTVDNNLARALDLVHRGAIRPEAMAIPHMPIAEAEYAYDLLRSRGDAVSVLFTYGSPA